MAKIKGREMQTQGQHSDVLSKMLGSKNLGSDVFRTLMCIVGKSWSK